MLITYLVTNNHKTKCNNNINILERLEYKSWWFEFSKLYKTQQTSSVTEHLPEVRMQCK